MARTLSHSKHTRTLSLSLCKVDELHEMSEAEIVKKLRAAGGAHQPTGYDFGDGDVGEGAAEVQARPTRLALAHSGGACSAQCFLECPSATAISNRPAYPKSPPHAHRHELTHRTNRSTQPDFRNKHHEPTPSCARGAAGGARARGRRESSGRGAHVCAGA